VQPIYLFGDVKVLCAERRLVVSGRDVSVGARAFDLLVALIERRDRVVSKEELLMVVWPGLVVEEANIQVQVSSLRKLIGAQALATVAGRGYRFSGLLLEAEVGAPVVQRTAQGEADGSDLPLPDKPSIAVLPFANLSADPEHRFFADGITQDIVTALSRFHSLFVIAHASTAGYSGNTAEVGTVATQLGVRYVVEGSVRRSGNQIRVTARLIDGPMRRHIWSQSYDRVLDEIFAVQEEVIQSIVAAVAPEIARAEISKARRHRPSNLSAYEIALRAWADMWKSYENADASQIESVILQAEQALAIDPASTLALNVIAFCRWQQVFFRSADSLIETWEMGLRAARQAIEHDRTDSLGYIVRANLLTVSPHDEGRSVRYDEALDDLRTALQLNPNDQLALRLLGRTEAISGNPEEGIAHLQQALRLNPQDQFSTNVVGLLSRACFLARKYEEGVGYGLRALRSTPSAPNILMLLAKNYVGTGNIEEARAAWTAAYRLAPKYMESQTEGHCVYRVDADRLRQKVFLRVAAGLEDPAAADRLR